MESEFLCFNTSKSGGVPLSPFLLLSINNYLTRKISAKKKTTNFRRNLVLKKNNHS